jgi:hypothetical protein
VWRPALRVMREGARPVNDARPVPNPCRTTGNLLGWIMETFEPRNTGRMADAIARMSEVQRSGIKVLAAQSVDMYDNDLERRTAACDFWHALASEIEDARLRDTRSWRAAKAAFRQPARAYPHS